MGSGHRPVNCENQKVLDAVPQTESLLHAPHTAGHTGTNIGGHLGRGRQAGGTPFAVWRSPCLPTVAQSTTEALRPRSVSPERENKTLLTRASRTCTSALPTNYNSRVPSSSLYKVCTRQVRGPIQHHERSGWIGAYAMGPLLRAWAKPHHVVLAQARLPPHFLLLASGSRRHGGTRRHSPPP